MAGGGSAEDSEPLFILEPLPKLSETIDSIASSNILVLLASFAIIIFLLVQMKDIMSKMWTTALFILIFAYFTTDSLFYAAILMAIVLFLFNLVWAALEWDQVKTALGIDNSRILSVATYVVATWVLVVLGYAIGMPTGPGIVICALVNAYLWWTYYSLEPARV